MGKPPRRCSRWSPVTPLWTATSAWAGCRLLFFGINGYDLTVTEDDRVDLTMAIADGRLSDVERIAEHLAGWVTRQ